MRLIVERAKASIVMTNFDYFSLIKITFDSTLRRFRVYGGRKIKLLEKMEKKNFFLKVRVPPYVKFIFLR